MDLDQFPISAAANRMLSYVTKGWYDNSYVGKWVYEVLGQELDIAAKLYEELPYQFFVHTATWGLCYHERKYGLPVREDLTYEERRALIVRKRESRYPMTPYRMEAILWERFGAEVHVKDSNDPEGRVFTHPNIFAVQFAQTGLERGLHLQAARALIEDLKLSHTAYELYYCHHIWVGQEIRYAAGLLFAMGLEARSEKNFGYQAAVLNGACHLDGQLLLNGYRSNLGPSEGLYDTGLDCLTEVRGDVISDVSWGVKASVKAPQSVVSQKMGLVFAVTLHGNTEASRLHADLSLPVHSAYAGGILIGKNLWRLDGKQALNGEKRLEAEEFVIGL